MKPKTTRLSPAFFIAMIFLVLGMINYQCGNSDSISSGQYAQIQEGFIVPQDTNKIWCYYYWIGDDISKEGVTKDLEAMKELGIGACLIGNINPDEVDGPVPLFSDEWWETMVHAVKEGDRLGVDIGFFNCPGWSQSGGPWVTSDKAMRHIVYSEAKVQGGQSVHTQLSRPTNEFQDTYVLGFKTLEAEEKFLSVDNAKIISTPEMKNVKNLLDGDRTTASLFKTDKNAEYKIQIKGPDNFTARSLRISPSDDVIKCNIELFATINGEEKSISSFVFDRSNMGVNVGPLTKGELAVSIPETTSGEFSLLCTDLWSGSKMAGFSEITLSGAPVMDRYVEKTLGKMHPTPFPRFNTYMWEIQESIENENMLISEVIDLSDKMDQNGNLNWDAPEGDWTILRFGMAPTGTKNSPAAPQGKGYEIDKANSALAQFHFKQYIGELLKRIPEENKDAFKYVIADSYEMGSQNWTDGFAEIFMKKYGYDPVKFLPVFSGRIVESVEKSERFLWDLRRAVADDVAYEYVGGLRKISNENNLKIWLENYGHWGYPGEFLMYGGQSDLVSGEFWNEGSLGDIECKSASSAAHMYGKPVTSAEAFTAANKSYERHPALLKKRGDWSFTEGINHFVLHLYIHQPDDIRIPGINAWFSTEFNRHNTWFDQGKNWVNYLRRNQHMLQQGKYAADVLYYIGEDAPKMTGEQNPELPSGYSYDYINAEVIKKRLSVRDGKFTLPDGTQYSLIVLPDVKTMRPEVLKKLEKLMNEGGAVLGPAPEKSPGLKDYPVCDQEVKTLAANIWGADYIQGKLIKKVGKGYIMNGIGIKEALHQINVSEDILIPDDAPVLWTHRTLPGMEIYFLSNQSDQVVNIMPSFRSEGLNPQYWNAVTGEIRILNKFDCYEGRTTVPVKLKALESCYIVFTNETNELVEKGYEINFPEPEHLLNITSTWNVDFLNKEIGPREKVLMPELEDWILSDNEKIKYYSGSAVYSTQFTIDEPLPEEGNVFVNLGKVGVMAEVSLNGQDLGGVWISPFRISAGEALRQGENTLEVKVVNVWRNRMKGDLSLPNDDRHTWTVVSDVNEKSELIPSGLMGPVSLELIK